MPVLINKKCFQDVMEAAFGKFGYVLLSIIQFAFPFIGEFSMVTSSKGSCKLGRLNLCRNTVV